MTNSDPYLSRIHDRINWRLTHVSLSVADVKYLFSAIDALRLALNDDLVPERHEDFHTIYSPCDDPECNLNHQTREVHHIDGDPRNNAVDNLEVAYRVRKR